MSSTKAQPHEMRLKILVAMTGKFYPNTKFFRLPDQLACYMFKSFRAFGVKSVCDNNVKRSSLEVGGLGAQY